MIRRIAPLVLAIGLLAGCTDNGSGDEPDDRLAGELAGLKDDPAAARAWLLQEAGPLDELVTGDLSDRDADALGVTIAAATTMRFDDPGAQTQVQLILGEILRLDGSDSIPAPLLDDLATSLAHNIGDAWPSFVAAARETTWVEDDLRELLLQLGADQAGRTALVSAFTDETMRRLGSAPDRLVLERVVLESAVPYGHVVGALWREAEGGGNPFEEAYETARGAMRPWIHEQTDDTELELALTNDVGDAVTREFRD